MRKRSFHVLVATDASPQARVALAATVAFPWPGGARAQGVMAAGVPGLIRWRRPARTALVSWLRREAVRVRRTLRRRWADAEVVVVDPPAVEAIVERARRWRAQAIVLGSRGRGALHRALLGSVSRGVIQRALCAVLVVKGEGRAPRRLLIGLDGSVRSRRAVGFVSGLQPPADGSVTLLAVVEPTRSTSIGTLPASIRAVVAAELAALDRQRLGMARREVSTAACRLIRAGWTVEKVVRRGIPLPELLRTASTRRADTIVLGARVSWGLVCLGGSWRRRSRAAAAWERGRGHSRARASVRPDREVRWIAGPVPLPLLSVLDDFERAARTRFRNPDVHNGEPDPGAGAPFRAR